MPRPSDPTLPGPSWAHSGGPGPGAGLLGLGCRASALGHVTKPQGTLGGCSTPDSSTSGECHHATYPLHLLVAGDIPRSSKQSFPQLCPGDIQP